MDTYGIIGHPVAHSLSPALHNAAFQSLRIDAIYEKYDVAPSNLEAFMRTSRAAGLSVTIPHKVAIMAYLDEIRPDAKAMGAVNTIKKEDGLLIGENVDWIGVMKSFQNYIPQKVIMVGAGGAARSIAYALHKMGCHDLTVLVRNTDAHRAFGEDFSCTIDSLESIERYAADTLINATQVGMNEAASVFPKKMISPDSTVFDVVYTPRETSFIKDAKAIGARTITGERMLLYQAIEQCEWWTGKKAPIDAMEQALEKVVN